jgi:transmembrane sensor
MSGGRKLRSVDGQPADPSGGADYWAAKQSLGLMGPREQAAFEAWRAEPANAEAYARASSVLDDVQDFAAVPEIRALRADALAAVAAVPSPPLGRLAPIWRRVAAVAASVVVLAGAGVWVARQADGPGATTTVAVRSDAPAVASTKRYETALGERREIHLDDGSLVALNTSSVLEVAFNAKRRDVRLVRGQALFRVAKNKAWPFVVTAGDRQVTAVGTTFDIRVDAGRVRVVLVEGRVLVDPLRHDGLARMIPQLEQESLSPGEQLVAQGEKPVTIATADIERTVSWKNGQVIFRDDTVAAAAAEMNRYSASRIVIADPRVANLKVSGVFGIDEPQNFVAALTTFYPIEAARPAPGVTELSWRGS